MPDLGQPSPKGAVTMGCALQAGCPFFNERMSATQTTLAMYRARYCREQYEECARYVVAVTIGREQVPVDLFPNDHLKAMGILRHAKHEADGVTPHANAS